MCESAHAHMGQEATCDFPVAVTALGRAQEKEKKKEPVPLSPAKTLIGQLNTAGVENVQPIRPYKANKIICSVPAKATVCETLNSINP